jgi:hypothetical protein
VALLHSIDMPGLRRLAAAPKPPLRPQEPGNDVYIYEPTPLKEGEEKHVISVFVADESGLINRVAGVFARRGEQQQPPPPARGSRLLLGRHWGRGPLCCSCSCSSTPLLRLLQAPTSSR